MGNRIIIISCIILKIYSVLTVVAGEQTRGADQWCRQTPYPGLCQSLLIPHPNPPITTTTQFVHLSVKLTVNGAMQSMNHTFSLRPKLTNPRQKIAAEDCLYLYDHAIRRLNQIVLCPTNHCSASRVQSWLSSALTSLDTCRVGLSENRVSDGPLPSMLHNITGLISNALALNKGGGKPVPKEEAQFLQTPSSTAAQNIDMVVAKDGSGDFRTVQAALDAAVRWKGRRRIVIYVKEGIYKEYIKINEKLTNLKLVGDGIGKTIITGDRSYGSGYSTFGSPTFVVEGDDFVARDITFRNTAGPENLQAVAVRCDSERTVFYKCSFEGYQDTLYVHSGSQFFRECDIVGTVDFIFGNSAAVFQNCSILARNPPNRVNTVTAQGRIDINQPTGIIIKNSVIDSAPDLRSSPGSGRVKTYLGRPWKPYSRTVVMKTYMGELIEPKGWLEWDNNATTLETLYYAEYANSGPGSNTSDRVKWPGFHAIIDQEEARPFALVQFLDASSWLPATSIPFLDD